ncbi:MAG: hypothetical protein HUJ31_01320 [Pseudomonadales bacterium]|nr:hypothetical protein [Pseudomonadales bacterium]
MVLIIQQCVVQALFISFIATHMNICWGKVSATQFAIYVAWANLARSIGAWIYGLLEPYLATGQEFLIMAVICLCGAGLVYMVNLGKHNARIEALDEAERPGQAPAVT